MQSLTHWPLAARRQITGVFTDIDDTLTTDGAITPDALAALGRLRAAGLKVIAVTGRPVGWSESFAKTWPLDGIVAENGAVLLHLQDQNRTQPNALLPGLLLKSYQQDEATRQSNFARLQHLAQCVMQQVPGATLAQDSAGRETDIAFDHSEFSHLNAAQIEEVVRLLRSEGAHATVSSIHINAWFGAHNKLTGGRWAVKTLLGRDLSAEMVHWVFVGDSSNDAMMFGAFDNSVGVANVVRFLPELPQPPRYITPSERGAGFVEVVQALLAQR